MAHETEAPTVILGVAASDSHVVANHLIAYSLRARGFRVINLGPCTSVAEFAAAYANHPETEAIIVGSLNGHAYEDLQELPAYRARGLLDCPVILGGNLSVGSRKDTDEIRQFYDLGVKVVLSDPELLPAVLDELRSHHVRPAALS